MSIPTKHIGDHQQPCNCWLCRDGLPDDLAERIKIAKPVGDPMTTEEFIDWITSIT